MAKGKDKEKAKRLFEDSPSDKGSQKHARKSLPEIPGLNRSEEAASTQELMDDLLFCEELPATPVRPIMKAVEDAMVVDSPKQQQEQSNSNLHSQLHSRSELLEQKIYQAERLGREAK